MRASSRGRPTLRLEGACVGLAVVLAAGILGEGHAAAQGRITIVPDRTGVPMDEFDVRLVPDLVLSLGMLGVALLLDASKVDLAGDLSCPDEPSEPTLYSTRSCDPETLNPVDRWATGLSVARAASLSDVLLWTSLSAPLVFSVSDLASERTSPGAQRLGQDALVISQTYAASFLVTAVLKVAVQRLRPYNYDRRGIAGRDSGDSRLSFPSGHTSMSFAGAATLSVLLDQRFPGRAWSVGLAAGGFAVATTVAILRILAGRHFPTDVLVGAAIGTAIGLLVPRFHRGSEPGGAPASDPEVMAVGLGGRF